MPKFLKNLQEMQEEKIEIEKEKKENEKKDINNLSENENINEVNDNKDNNEKNNDDNKNSKIITQKDYIQSLKDKDKEIKNLTKKYENILEQKEKIILDLNSEINLIKSQNLTNISKYEEELLKLNELLMDLINNYQRYFLSNLTPKCSPITLNNKKEQFDQILLSIKNEYNMFSFPLLYNIKSKKGILTNYLKFIL